MENRRLLSVSQENRKLADNSSKIDSRRLPNTGEPWWLECKGVMFPIGSTCAGLIPKKLGDLSDLHTLDLTGNNLRGE